MGANSVSRAADNCVFLPVSESASDTKSCPKWEKLGTTDTKKKVFEVDSAAVNSSQSTAATQPSSGSSGGLTSFFGGGSQSGTATEAPRGNASQPASSQPSSFSAFSGKGVSLGSDIESTQSTSSMFSNFLGSGNKNSSSTYGVEPQEAATRGSSAPSQALEDKHESDTQTANDPNRSIDEDDNQAPFIHKKTKDDKGAYQQVDNDNV